MVVIVEHGHDIQEYKAFLERCSDNAADACSAQGAFRSQIDFRLVTINRVSMQSQESLSPSKRFFRSKVAYSSRRSRRIETCREKLLSA